MIEEEVSIVWDVAHAGRPYNAFVDEDSIAIARIRGGIVLQQSSCEFEVRKKSREASVLISAE